MAICINCNREISNTATKCRYCYVETFPTVTEDILMTSTGSVEGYEIIEYLGIAYGEEVCPNGILGALTTRTFFTYSAVALARQNALNKLKTAAKEMGANAVVGVDIDICDLNGNGSFVSVNGSAVYIIPENYVENQKTKAEKTEVYKENRKIREAEEQRREVEERQRRETEQRQEQERRETEQRQEQERIQEMLGDCVIDENYIHIAKIIIKTIDNQEQLTVSSLVRSFAGTMDLDILKEVMDKLVEENIIIIDASGYIKFV